MRVLTVRQPWAWAIIHGGKDVENRSRNIAGFYRGPVAIHAGLARPEQHNMASRAHRAAHGGETPTDLVFGAIIGVVDLTDAHLSRLARGATTSGQPMCFNDGTPIGRLCSPWAMTWFYHLVVANPRPLAQPIPAKGRLGLWRPDDELRAAIAEQLHPDQTGGEQ